MGRKVITVGERTTTVGGSGVPVGGVVLQG